MEHFSNKLEQNKEIKPPKDDGYKEIKPETSIDSNSVKDYWNDLFSQNIEQESFEFTEDQIIDEIYSCSESDFKFDFDTYKEEFKEVLSKFDKEHWDKLDYLDKTDVIYEFADLLYNKLEISSKPIIVFIEDDMSNCGSFNVRTKVLKINDNYFNDPKEIIDTVAHELRHAYQHERAEKGETRNDMRYQLNFENYISPVFYEGYCLNFNEYQDQLVEAEARAYAKMFTEMGGK